MDFAVIALFAQGYFNPNSKESESISWGLLERTQDFGLFEHSDTGFGGGMLESTAEGKRIKIKHPELQFGQPQVRGRNLHVMLTQAVPAVPGTD